MDDQTQNPTPGPAMPSEPAAPVVDQGQDQSAPMTPPMEQPADAGMPAPTPETPAPAAPGDMGTPATDEPTQEGGDTGANQGNMS